MYRKLAKLGGLAALVPMLVPSSLWAAGGKAAELVVVADTRVLTSPVNRYFANLYNTDILVFAVWAVVLTALLGCILGVIMDRIMMSTGIDLTKRKIIEH
ncbi:hypothetical protein RVX_R28440 [Nitratidesulfovibrio sp. HK-II]|uniref:DVU0150 family protein n=1 Tax=Nitratidesulfovibrio sp. HK-II TaxID=2009266 RepID=UPI000E2EDD77|nr:DVU0150 family protein [Nitratidesulfovibrio sp. HK-II]GBO97842.1 hypothetical protein RVX_2881 [Nitratidesulfovibrio sp. HK-II]